MAEPITLKKEQHIYKVVLEAEVLGDFMHASHLAERLLDILKRELRARPLFYQIQKCTIDVPGMHNR